MFLASTRWRVLIPICSWLLQSCFCGGLGAHVGDDVYGTLSWWGGASYPSAVSTRTWNRKFSSFSSRSTSFKSSKQMEYDLGWLLGRRSWHRSFKWYFLFHDQFNCWLQIMTQMSWTLLFLSIHICDAPISCSISRVEFDHFYSGWIKHETLGSLKTSGVQILL